MTQNQRTPEKVERGTSLWQNAWRRLARNRLAVAGLCVLCVVVASAVAGPWLSPYGPRDQDTDLGAAPPSLRHWFGTDQLGQDLLTLIFYGGRVSLMVGFAATSVSLVIGVVYGAVAGFADGRTDAVMMRLVDILYALPFTIFVIVLMVFFGRNIVLLFLAIGAVQWLTMARIVRAQVMSLTKKEFIQAARIMGIPRRKILARHLIPNVLGPIVVYSTLTVPNVMLIEATLSYLGLGVETSSWGVLIKEGVDIMEECPWALVFPSTALSLTLFSLNFLGDGLRDALDPRAAKD